MRAMTPKQVEVAASRDPDNRPLSRIPIGTWRDWEQRRATPDQTARACLTVIARDPEGVRRALDPPRQ